MTVGIDGDVASRMSLRSWRSRPDERWTWRERAHDPRFFGFLALLLASAVLASAVFGLDTGAALFTVTFGVVVVLFALPPWRDPKHGPAAGAAVLCGGAALMLALAWVVR